MQCTWQHVGYLGTSVGFIHNQHHNISGLIPLKAVLQPRVYKAASIVGAGSLNINEILAKRSAFSLVRKSVSFESYHWLPATRAARRHVNSFLTCCTWSRYAALTLAISHHIRGHRKTIPERRNVSYHKKPYRKQLLLPQKVPFTTSFYIILTLFPCVCSGNQCLRRDATQTQIANHEGATHHQTGAVLRHSKTHGTQNWHPKCRAQSVKLSTCAGTKPRSPVNRSLCSSMGCSLPRISGSDSNEDRPSNVK
jgi:hypothetical protein